MKTLAIIMVVLLMAPIAAQARMESMSEDSMGVIHGQVGITINFETHLSGSYVAITDSDGDDGSYPNQGALTIYGLDITKTGANDNMVVTGLTLDVGTDSGGNPALCIGLPQITGHVQIDEVRIGGSATAGNSLGAITWGNIDYAPTTCTVYPH
ncbi:hypothetical protein SAMN02745216_02315 [Desulfatibacillum alkenivorans DSM 16219]|jgi:hypothetical protein|uniref:DUF6160 domain-containing protein n=1 Tax=Desulfatibacillum alkenivorans DSM 16219 TaxID=1121393 RepID=A0A1M6MCH9_9BACT|nr:DUF6160 family protein [Desulfatibacillum alkenivorans]SHJ81087.1 hypothetical protein SAMN02745216_02315 [Desulfatibacillum alkenivorans DSM 16219]